MTQTSEYQKGYAAGKRRADRTDRTERDEERAHGRRMARMALAAAIAPKIIETPWRQKKGNDWVSLNDVAGISGAVRDLVTAIEAKLS